MDEKFRRTDILVVAHLLFDKLLQIQKRIGTEREDPEDISLAKALRNQLDHFVPPELFVSSASALKPAFHEKPKTFRTRTRYTTSYQRKKTVRSKEKD